MGVTGVVSILIDEVETEGLVVDMPMTVAGLYLATSSTGEMPFCFLFF